MQESIEGFLALPGWVQAFLGFFVVTLVVMIVEPRVRNRRAGARFATLAEARGGIVKPGHDEFAESFAVVHAGRPFTIRRERRLGAKGASYRGPRGHLLITETVLASPRWKTHGIDVAQSGWMARLGSRPFRTGDAAFDERFRVWQDGLPVRESWLDAPTRAAFVALFDLPSITKAGTVWVQDGTLQLINDTPRAIDAAGLTVCLDRQAALAAALDTTAGWRGL